MIVPRLLAIFFIVLYADGRKNNNRLEICDELEVKSSVIRNETLLEKTFSNPYVNELFKLPKLLEFSHENVSIECKQASEGFKKSFANFELWALESMNVCD